MCLSRSAWLPVCDCLLFEDRDFTFQSVVVPLCYLSEISESGQSHPEISHKAKH